MFSNQQPSLLPLTQQQLHNLNRGENYISSKWEKTRLEKIIAQRNLGEDIDISFVAKETETFKSSIISNNEEEETSGIDSSSRPSLDSRDREIAEKLKDGFEYNTAALLYRAKKILSEPPYETTPLPTTEVATNNREKQIENGSYHGRINNSHRQAEKNESQLYSTNFTPQERENFINKKLSAPETDRPYEHYQNDESHVLEYSFDSDRGGNFGGIEDDIGHISADLDEPDASLITEIMKRGYTSEEAIFQSARFSTTQRHIVTPSEHYLGRRSVGENAGEDGDVVSEIDRIMSRGYTREQAVKMQHQESLRKLSQSGTQAFSKMMVPDDVTITSLKSKSAEKPAIIVKRKTPDTHAHKTSVHSKNSAAFNLTSPSTVERALFPEEVRKTPLPMPSSSSLSPSAASFASTPPPVDAHIELLMASGYTREQAVLEQQNRLAQRSRNISSHNTPNSTTNTINRSGDGIGSTAATPGLTIVPIDPLLYNNFPVVEPASPGAGNVEVSPAYAIDLDYIRQRQYPPCYYSLQLDNDEALEVGKWISRYTDITREGAIYLFFQERMHSSWPAISAFKSRRAIANQKSVDERALEMGILLSEQTRHFRMNMYEMLAKIPHDQIGLEVLMEMGLGYDDAVLFLFEKRVVFYTATPSSTETGTSTAAAAVNTTAPDNPSPDAQQESSIWQRLFRTPAWFRSSSPTRRRQQPQQQPTPPQQTPTQQQQQQQTPPLPPQSPRQYASPPRQTPNRTPLQPSPQQGNTSSPESLNDSHDDYIHNMRRVLKYERLKRRDVENVMRLACATEEQAVHALLATDFIVQDAVHLLLNTT